MAIDERRRNDGEGAGVGAGARRLGHALSEGVDPDLIASVAIYAALADMVDRYGEEAVKEFCASLPERVRKSEFTLRANDA